MPNTPLYSLIMHGNPEFWSGNEGYVDFPRDRFLEYTDDHLKTEFQSLDPNTINRLKTLPTLFAVEHENADTRVGKVTDIEVQPRNLRVHYQFNDKQNQLTKGALETQELGLDADKYEFYRTHWALKEANLNDFLKERSKTLEGIFDKIKQDLDTHNPDKPDRTKVTVLYACNASLNTEHLTIQKRREKTRKLQNKIARQHYYLKLPIMPVWMRAGQRKLKPT